MGYYSLNKTASKAKNALLMPSLLAVLLLAFPHLGSATDNELPTLGNSVNSASNSSSHSLSEQELNQLFQHAVNNDLVGNPSQARKDYDTLAATRFAPLVAVPSAVNYAALENFEAAKKSFASLMNSHDVKDADYARLWDLWLTARTWTKGKTALEKALTEKVSGYQWHTAYGQAIADLYAGKISAENLFNIINDIPDRSTVIKADAQTEATFFAGGYFQYVKGDIPKAREVYQSSNAKLNDISLEHPLIKREIEKINKLN